MSSDLKEQITDRFVTAIRGLFKPCPLIGPKWLQEYPTGKPADFRFFGVNKLAKAIGIKPKKIIQLLVQNVSFEGLDVEAEVVHDNLIDINRKGKPRKAPKPYVPGTKPTGHRKYGPEKKA